jgi:hypothetical protein
MRANPFFRGFVFCNFVENTIYVQKIFLLDAVLLARDVRV